MGFLGWFVCFLLCGGFLFGVFFPPPCFSTVSSLLQKVWLCSRPVSGLWQLLGPLNPRSKLMGREGFGLVFRGELRVTVDTECAVGVRVGGKLGLNTSSQSVVKPVIRGQTRSSFIFILPARAGNQVLFFALRLQWGTWLSVCFCGHKMCF